MRSLSASELVAVWERGLAEHPLARALTLLEACSGEERHALAALPIGRRDARLLAIYEHLFGPSIDAFAECPACAERLEYSLSAPDLLVQSTTQPDETALTLQSGELTLRLRLLNSLDLTAASRCADASTARSALMKQCVVEASQGGRAVPVPTLPDSAVEAVAARLADLDPQAEMLIDLTCAACRHRWQVLLDIEHFLWVKIAALAKRLLREVHILARAYGWSEPEILGLSALRRQCYIDLVSS
jgi:hypothetical protein